MKISNIDHSRNDAPPFSTVVALPDTGANKSIISKRVLDSLFLGFVTAKAKKYKILTANKTELACLGTVNLSIFYEGRLTFLNALVSDNLHEDFLISCNDLKRMGVLHEGFPGLVDCPSLNANLVKSDVPDTFEGLLDEFKEVFNEETISPMHGSPMHIHINRDTPGYRPLKMKVARRTPKHFQDKAKELIQRLLSSGIIVKVPATESLV